MFLASSSLLVTVFADKAFYKQKNASLLKKQRKQKIKPFFTLSTKEKLNFTAKRWISWCKMVVQVTMSVDELYCTALRVLLDKGRAQLKGSPKYSSLKGKVDIEFSIFKVSSCHLILTRHILVVWRDWNQQKIWIHRSSCNLCPCAITFSKWAIWEQPPVSLLLWHRLHSVSVVPI